jgi:hypothetical protein
MLMLLLLVGWVEWNQRNQFAVVVLLAEITNVKATHAAAADGVYENYI